MIDVEAEHGYVYRILERDRRTARLDRRRRVRNIDRRQGSGLRLVGPELAAGEEISCLSEATMNSAGGIK